MHRSEILDRLREQPFRPFRIHLSNGLVHEIRHPELAWVTGTSMLLGIPTAQPKLTGDLDDYMMVSLSHIVQTEPVPAVTPGSSNGAKST